MMVDEAISLLMYPLSRNHEEMVTRMENRHGIPVASAGYHVAAPTMAQGDKNSVLLWIQKGVI